MLKEVRDWNKRNEETKEHDHLRVKINHNLGPFCYVRGQRELSDHCVHTQDREEAAPEPLPDHSSPHAGAFLLQGRPHMQQISQI